MEAEIGYNDLFSFNKRFLSFRNCYEFDFSIIKDLKHYFNLFFFAVKQLKPKL
jgi:hypothetical protein